jgi:hypothetical protein
MKRLRLWPVFDRGSSQGERYRITNDVLKGEIVAPLAKRPAS